MDQNLAAPLLRIMGNEASKSDVAELLETLLASDDLRAQCSALSSLVQEHPIETRQQWCAALVVTLISTLKPQEDPPMKDGQIDQESFLGTTPAFCVYCCPKQDGKWIKHVEGRFRKKGTPEFAKISPYFYSIVSALEALWNVQGHLLKR